jgi:polyvinyl alcohol dehydrogenase (cytochrome)
MVRRKAAVVAVLSALATAVGITPAARAATGAGIRPCTTSSRGGDWPSYGHDSSNTRSQPAEHAIGPAQAGSLAPAWRFSVGDHGGAGIFNSTPVEAGGCVYAGTSSGDVYALNADTGAVVWHERVTDPAPGYGGAVVGAPTVWQGTVYVIVNVSGDGRRTGSYVAAFDAATGRTLWDSAPFQTASGSFSNASQAVFALGGEGAPVVIFAGFSGPEGNSSGQGGFALVDARRGMLLRVTDTIPPARRARGHAGGGIWSTAAYDPATGFAYAGTGNPFSKTEADPNTNAIVKIDLRPASANFGDIVAAYDGEVDQYTQSLQFLSQTPGCAATSGVSLITDDPVCGQLDLDFGASANLFRVANRMLIGDLQKSGVYHVADAVTMKPVWATRVGATCYTCNAGSTAVDETGVYGEAAPGGVEFGLDLAAGSQRWVSPVGDAVHFESTALADGVVYTLDSTGSLDAWDEAAGLPLLRRPLAVDTGAPSAALTSAGVSVARHTVYVAADTGALSAAGDGGVSTPAQISNGWILAYRPG